MPKVLKYKLHNFNHQMSSVWYNRREVTKHER